MGKQMTDKRELFKAKARKLKAPELKMLFDGLKEAGDEIPLDLLVWTHAEYRRAIQDPERNGQ